MILHLTVGPYRLQLNRLESNHKVENGGKDKAG